MRQICQIYRICCKWVTIPFIWKNNKLILTKPNTFWNYLAWIFLVTKICMQMSRISLLHWSSDINSVILYGIYLLLSLVSLVCKLNIWVHQTEYSQLIQGVMQINADWGKNFTFVLKNCMYNKKYMTVQFL